MEHKKIRTVQVWFS